MNENKNPDIDFLVARLASQELMLENYRRFRFIGKLATNKSKDSAWYMAKTWAPFWREIAFDLKTETEQKAFLFD